MKNNPQKNRVHPQRNQPLPRDVMALTASIDVTDDRVCIPRDDYDKLLYSAAIMDILQRLYKTNNSYAASELLGNLFQETGEEKEDK